MRKEIHSQELSPLPHRIPTHDATTSADLPGFSTEQIIIAHGVITVLVCGHPTSGHCPECAHLSSRIHSRYQHTLADLPWSGSNVRLVVQVHRFFCTQPTCLRKTFTEAIPAVAERYARRTNRLKAVLERLGLTLGGEPASRLAAVLAMGCSPDTVLRLLRRLRVETVEAPRVVSLDDWMARIYRELTTKVYKGSYESARNLIISHRPGDRHAPLQSGTPMTSRQATWLFLRRPEDLTRDEQQTLAQLRNLDRRGVDLVHEMVQQFVHMQADANGRRATWWLAREGRKPPSHRFASRCLRHLSR